MKIGIFTALFGDKSLTETLDLVRAEGIEAVEFGAGAYPGAAHLDVAKLLTSTSPSSSKASRPARSCSRRCIRAV